ncbi:chaperonin 10-like protein [Xylariales sp. PMI_506]|nr:chaperonin 10-like protein [Xylariales sp. PMI_506]
MASIETNQAAWLTGKQVKPLEVGPGPDQTKPEGDEIIIHVAAVAINPVECFVQNTGIVPLKYPRLLGSDIAGTVVKVGPETSRIKVGDRVFGHCLGLANGNNRHAGFQNFTTCREVAAAKIPDTLSFEQAVVLPLALNTSIAALFGPTHLNLRLPTSVEEEGSVGSGGDKANKKEIVLIWGAASSLGTNAVQLALAAGYDVVTTASAKNHGYVTSLAPASSPSSSRSLSPPGEEGKSRRPVQLAVFDHADPNVADEIIAHIRGSGAGFVGAYDCISRSETVAACAAVVRAVAPPSSSASSSSSSRLIAVVLPSAVVAPLEGENDSDKVTADIVWGSEPATVPGHRGAAVWAEFMAPALESGQFRALPEPVVVGSGLEEIQKALDYYSAGGISAKKVVVTI